MVDVKKQVDVYFSRRKQFVMGLFGAGKSHYSIGNDKGMAESEDKPDLVLSTCNDIGGCFFRERIKKMKKVAIVAQICYYTNYIKGTQQFKYSSVHKTLLKAYPNFKAYQPENFNIDEFNRKKVGGAYDCAGFILGL